MSNGIPCPNCGGRDRFCLIATPRNGRAPFRFCRVCHHYEPVDPNAAPAGPTSIRTLTPQERAQAHLGYTAIARWCADALWTPAGTPALSYLRARGLSDDTIREAGLGWHPDTWRDGVGPALWQQDRTAYDGATIGGLLGPQGRPKGLLRGVITLPYWDGSICTLIRTRKLNSGNGSKYFSPAGISLYAGATPILYNQGVLQHTDKAILTEGELKALPAWGYWKAGSVSMPAVAQPGVGYLPDAFLDALSHKTVYLIYDREQRKDPFVLSPGEIYTIRNGEKLTGLGLERRIALLRAQLKKAHKQADQAEVQRLQQEIDQLELDLQHVQNRAIRVKVVRLPRQVDEDKVDLDSFLLQHGPQVLQALLDAAPSFEDWHEHHGEPGYRYSKGGIWEGQRRLANYQARIIEHISQHDGMEETTVYRLALQSPSGAYHEIDVPATTWSDPRKAMEAVRAGLHDATWQDESKDTFDAIKSLSRHGDDPQQRTVYTCTGWQRISGHWHYLVPDGAITRDGVISHIASNIPPYAQGNHYALCGAGDAQRGAQAFLPFLRGEVCPQPIALVLTAHAVLAFLHRFLGVGDRPAIWPVGESGVMKTALVRVLLSLFGPAFTAERADGAPLLKWDSTYNALELNAFTYRDIPFIIDDYKQATAGRDVTGRFLHAYSEGSSRGRMTYNRKHDRIYPARGLAIITGEDRPAADPGQLGRVLLFSLRKGDVDPNNLAQLQHAGVAGDLAAFWRGFIQAFASQLDAVGEAGVQKQFQALLQSDDDTLPGHQRTAGALRQNRTAWLVCSNYLRQAGYITAEEAEKLNAAHLEARRILAKEQQAIQAEERPAAIFLNVIREALATGEASLDDPTVLPERVIGFEHHGAIALYPDKCWKLVDQWRGQRRVQYTPAAVCQQLASDGLLADTDTKGGKTTKPVWHNGRTQRVLLLRPEALEAPDDSDPLTPLTPPYTSGVMQDTATETHKEDDLTPITPNLNGNYKDNSPNTDTTVKNTTIHSDRCKGVMNGSLPHQEASNGLTPACKDRCKANGMTDDDRYWWDQSEHWLGQNEFKEARKAASRIKDVGFRDELLIKIHHKTEQGKRGAKEPSA